MYCLFINENSDWAWSLRVNRSERCTYWMRLMPSVLVMVESVLPIWRTSLVLLWIIAAVLIVRQMHRNVGRMRALTSKEVSFFEVRETEISCWDCSQHTTNNMRLYFTYLQPWLTEHSLRLCLLVCFSFFFGRWFFFFFQDSSRLHW